ncbi:hypothetical protein TNCV_2426321 [Trichonephila clavipes]|nr:hypothetical protein TNCV_2426321 [Trichonephila clavipes]
MKCLTSSSALNSIVKEERPKKKRRFSAQPCGTANARVPSQKQPAFTSRQEQLESVSSTRERSVDICSRLLPLDGRLYLAPSASILVLQLRRRSSSLVLQRHRRSGGLSFLPTPISVQVSFFSALLKFSGSRALLPSPKKALLNTRIASTTRPSSLLIGRPQKSPSASVGPFMRNEQKHSRTVWTKMAIILVQHLDTLVHYTTCVLKSHSLDIGRGDRILLRQASPIVNGVPALLYHYGCESECRRSPEVKQ